MNTLLFYLQYAARNLWRSRRWATFAVFSVAAGVATVVALRSLGLAIGDSLTTNLRDSNRGDITISKGGSGFSFLNFQTPSEVPTFTPEQIARVQAWAETHAARMTVYTATSGLQVSSLDFSSAGRPQFVSSTFIDPQTFPAAGDLLALDPPNVPLGALFSGGNEIVLSKNLADEQRIKVGDRVRVGGTSEEFVVRGIVPTEIQAGLRDLASAFFGFAFFDAALAESLPVPKQPNRISLALPEGATAEQIAQAENQLRGVLNDSVSIRTVPQMLRENQNIADILGSFIVVMGLGALLLGGVGIINTMLVTVGRRTEEIAALKTFGLKGRQIAAIFLSEALLLGISGSALGVVAGVLLSSVANAYGQTLIQQPLTWRIYPEAALFGLALGVVVTLVFGVLPVLTAVKIRPAIILRPNETVIPRAGCLQSLFALLFVVLALGLIAGQMLVPAFNVANSAPSNPYTVGIIGVAFTLLFLAFLIGVLWLVVWLVGKLPSFGIVDLRLAQRNLTTRRVRTATTLLALSAGMFALSSISFVGAGTSEILRFTLSQAFGGNVLIFPVLPPAISNPLIDAKLNALEGVTYRTRYLNYSGALQAVDGRSLGDPLNGMTPEEVAQAMRAAGQRGDFDEMRRLGRLMGQQRLQITARDTNNPELNSGQLLAGRDITLADRRQRVAVVRLNETLTAAGVQVGSILTVEINERPYDFEVIGLLPNAEDADNLQQSMTIGDLIIPPQALDRVEPQFQLNVAQIEPEHLNRALVEISALPLVYALDITYIDGLLSRFINQFSAVPILVGLLSLGAAAVIMANTVALSMLERRRQIGILKAVGLKGRRVLSVMLLENTLVSLLGGLLGIGLSSVGVVVMTNFGLPVTMLIPTDALPIAVALVAAAVVIAWVATYLSAGTVLGERVTNVLRYE